MQILVLLGMYFDAVVVFVTSQTLLFRLALAILWNQKPNQYFKQFKIPANSFQTEFFVDVILNKHAEVEF